MDKLIGKLLTDSIFYNNTSYLNKDVQLNTKNIFIKNWLKDKTNTEKKTLPKYLIKLKNI